MKKRRNIQYFYCIFAVENFVIMFTTYSASAGSGKTTANLQPDGTAFRPDRVVFLHGRVTVLDYKTGKRQEENEAGYRKQVEGYCSLLRQMGYTDEDSRLVEIAL